MAKIGQLWKGAGSDVPIAVIVDDQNSIPLNLSDLKAKVTSGRTSEVITTWEIRIVRRRVAGAELLNTALLPTRGAHHFYVCDLQMPMLRITSMNRTSFL